MSNDISIRSSTLTDAEGIVLVHIKAWQESYQDFYPPEYLATLSYEERLSARKEILSKNDRNALHLVVLDGEKIVGFCDAGPAEGIPGAVYAIYLLEKYKRKGLGLKLMTMADQFLRDKGLVPYVVWVLEENTPARKLYEKLGGKVQLERVDERSGTNHKVVGYVFNSSS